ncbi:extracellular solute-binding protein [Mediterraneibacter sp. NSJ-55]|uniref:Extracellular solute-binding protein n=1 Tax=Mediterraneibacter hominis TaxID=2763054 RepID=A0A923RS90_9FIRM|nr:extracellular solute-binding protein [Mediterraneibacter hominis]MBC5689117.1 extracellular solute-binding protein [Mediterraneibacter hominis]
MKKKVVAVVCVLSMSMSLAAGCGNKEEGAGGNGVVEISFPTFMCGTASQTEWVKERVEAFNEEYKDQYKVVMEEIPGDQNYIDKMKVLYSADDLPDVIVTGGYNLIDSMQDKLVDLTPYVEEDPEWAGFMSDVGKNVNTRDGKLYAIPYIRQTIGYFYNTELFEEAGIEQVPETWDEFFEDCDKLLAAGITPVSMDTAESGWVTSLMLGAMIGDSDTGEEFMNTNQPDDYNNDEVVKAAGMIQEMFQKYTTADAVGGAYAEAANNFFNEKTAIIANGPWMVSKFYDTSVVSEDFGDRVAVATFPGNVMYNSGQIGWSIASKTEEKIEASLAFVKFMTSEESQKLDLEMCSVIPDCVITDADVYSQVQDTINLADSASRSINDFQSLWHATVVDEISVQYPLLADGSITPEEFAQALTDAAQ